MALDGRADTARPGLLMAHGELRDAGAAHLQAIAGVVMAALLGVDDPGVRAAVDESRGLLEGMGAGLWLSMLDAVLGERTPGPPGLVDGPPVPSPGSQRA